MTNSINSPCFKLMAKQEDTCMINDIKMIWCPNLRIVTEMSRLSNCNLDFLNYQINPRFSLEI